ncbi:MAG: hypothetical protein JNG84_06770 [Archangium sp.]|nr:hypothetical protein [Archangium sp.]
MGIIPRASNRGPSATYSDEARIRLLAATTLVERGHKVSLLKDIMSLLPAETIYVLAGELPPQESASPAPRAAPSATTWVRISLAPGVELHVDPSIAAAPVDIAGVLRSLQIH